MTITVNKETKAEDLDKAFKKMQKAKKKRPN